MGCGVYWQQVHTVEREIAGMEKWGVSTTDPGYLLAQREKARLMSVIGWKFPRTTLMMGEVSGLSPGVIKVWLDIESGWMSEARERPGAPPIYKSVNVEVAAAIMKGELTKELETTLMAPDDYLGE